MNDYLKILLDALVDSGICPDSVGLPCRKSCSYAERVNCLNCWKKSLKKQHITIKKETKLSLDSVIDFGKYIGETYRTVYAEDPLYIDWLRENTSKELPEETILEKIKNIF